MDALLISVFRSETNLESGPKYPLRKILLIKLNFTVLNLGKNTLLTRPLNKDTHPCSSMDEEINEN